MKKAIVTIIGWAFSHLSERFPAMFYIDLWSRDKTRRVGPGNIGGWEMHPMWLGRIAKAAGMKIEYMRQSSL